MVGKYQLRFALGQATRREASERDFWRPQLLQKLLTECLKVHYAADKEEENRVSALVESLFVN